MARIDDYKLLETGDTVFTTDGNHYPCATVGPSGFTVTITRKNMPPVNVDMTPDMFDHAERSIPLPDAPGLFMDREGRVWLHDSGDHWRILRARNGVWPADAGPWRESTVTGPGQWTLAGGRYGLPMDILPLQPITILGRE